MKSGTVQSLLEGNLSGVVLKIVGLKRLWSRVKIVITIFFGRRQIITDRVRSTRGGYIFTLYTICGGGGGGGTYSGLDGGGGVPTQV